MKKLFVLLLLFTAILLASCNTETQNQSSPNDSADDTNHIHIFSDTVEFDELGHFTTCECGEISRSEHIMEDAEMKKITDCVERSEAKCKDCEYIVESQISKISHIYKDELCTKCGSHEPSDGITFEFRDEYGWIAVYEEVDEEVTELYIPAYTDNGEKVVGVDCFDGLKSLKKVVIPNNVKYILPNAFENCTALESIEYEGTIEEWRNIDVSDTALTNTSVKRVFCSDGIVELFNNQINTAQVSNRSNFAKI